MKKNWLTLGLTALLTLSLTACGGEEAAPAPEAEAPAPQVEVIEGDPIYAAGTYTGVGAGYTDDITVSVEVSETQITGITVVENLEGNIGKKVFPDLSAAMLAANSFEVEAVSGASVTSAGFKEAVFNALQEALIP